MIAPRGSTARYVFSCSFMSVYATVLASLHVVYYIQSMMNTDVQQQLTTCMLNREDIPSNNTPPDIRVINVAIYVF